MHAGEGPQIIERSTERVDDPPEKIVSDAHIHDPAGPGHFLAGLKVGIVPQQHDTDFMSVHVERDAR